MGCRAEGGGCVALCDVLEFSEKEPIGAEQRSLRLL